MRLPARYDLGAATHTGLRRAANEDDYLLLAPPGGELLLAIADGMGGVAGGAEASRAAVRAFAAACLATPAADVEARLQAGFTAAAARVHEIATAVPSLRDMGTTLTAVACTEQEYVLGHVGDTRALLLRGGQLAQLTEDHAVREPDNVLLRCIGGGQGVAEPDLIRTSLQAGDVLALLSDGIWSTVAESAIAEALTLKPAQAAADRLLQLALAAGGPDNATAVVLRLGIPTGGERELALPHEESGQHGGLQPRSLRRRSWPWLVIGVAVVLAALALVRLWWPAAYGGWF